LLNWSDYFEVNLVSGQILPNGEIREVGQASAADLGTKKPLTMKENLGGEY